MNLKLRIDIDSLIRDEGLTTAQFAKKAALTVRTIGALRRGERDPGKRVIAGLMRATGKEWDELFEVTEETE